MILRHVLKYCYDYVRIINDVDHLPFLEEEKILYEGYIIGVPSALRRRSVYKIYPSYIEDGKGDALLITLK